MGGIGIGDMDGVANMDWSNGNRYGWGGGMT